MKPLTILIVTHNRLEYTKRTVESLKRTVPYARMFIYDNNSTEEGMSAYLISEECPADVFLNHQNEGWGYAVNYLTKFVPNSGNEIVLISNNDVEYHDGWYERCLALYEKYPNIGILGVWKHIAHGVKEDLGDLIIKDQMPAVGWLFKKQILEDIGPIVEHGPCATKGGNGEDVDYCIRAEQKGYWVCGPKEDVATHLDGF